MENVSHGVRRRVGALVSGSTRDKAAEFLKRGWRSVPVPEREKGPRLPGWNRLRVTEETLGKYFDRPGLNIGVLLGDANDWLVDVDLDVPEAIDLAPEFLPPTPAIFGRRGKPRSHWLYYSVGARTIKELEPAKTPGAHDPTIVELRSSGLQTIFPGSVHPSGEPVEWESDGDPRLVSADELEQAVRMLAEAAKLVRQGWQRAAAIKLAREGRITQAPKERQADTFQEAVDRYNREHAKQYPRSGGQCPGCGHKDCFGQMPKTDRWYCFSAAHTQPGIRGKYGYHGDALDIDAHEQGRTRAEVLRLGGYLSNPAQPHQGVATESKPQTIIDRLRPLTEAELLEQWRTAKQAAFIPTGIRALDEAIGGGFPTGQVSIVIGGTGSGKSELARHVRNRAAADGHGVVHVDVELGARRIAERNISQVASIASAILRKRDEWSDNQTNGIFSAIGEMDNAPIRTICPGGAVPLVDLEASIRLALSDLPKDKPALVILDSAQRLAASFDSDTQRLQVQGFMWWVSALAQATDAAFLVTSEMKRLADGEKPDPGRLLGMPAESRSLEHVADVLFGILPEADAGDEIAGAATSVSERRCRIVIAKTREGRTGVVQGLLVFKGPCWEMSYEAASDELSERILSFLRIDGAATATEIYNKVGGKKQATLNRVKHLESMGLIVWSDKWPKEGYRINDAER